MKYKTFAETIVQQQKEGINVKKRRMSFVAVFLVFVLITINIPYIEAHATNTLNQLNQAQQQKEEMGQEKEELQEELGDLNQQHGSMKAELNSLNRELTETMERIAQLEEDISEKEAEITQTQLELEEAIRVEGEQHEAMQNRMQASYESPESDYLEMLLSAKSIAELLNYADYISMLADYDTLVLERYQAAKDEVAAKEALLQQELAELEMLKQQNEDEKARIDSLIETTSAYVKKYATEISDAEEELKKIESELAAKEAEIEALRTKYEEELRLSQLANSSAKRDISQVVFEEGDRYLLANLIYCEAGGEPYEGQVAVGAVVMNRVLSSRFPDTVSGVIYQRRQFSPVASGRLAFALANNKATPSCYQAADEAMAGVTNVGGCVFFRTPIPGLTGQQIGGHIFY